MNNYANVSEQDLLNARIHATMDCDFVKQLSNEIAHFGYTLKECYAEGELDENNPFSYIVHVSLEGADENYPIIKTLGGIDDYSIGFIQFGIEPVGNKEGNCMCCTLWDASHKTAMKNALKVADILESKDWRLCPILNTNLRDFYISLQKQIGFPTYTVWRVFANSREEAIEKLSTFIEEDEGFKEVAKAFDTRLSSLYNIFAVPVFGDEWKHCTELTSESLRKEYQDYVLDITSFTYHQYHWDNNSKTQYCDKYGIDFRHFNYATREYEK